MHFSIAVLSIGWTLVARIVAGARCVLVVPDPVVIADTTDGAVPAVAVTACTGGFAATDAATVPARTWTPGTHVGGNESRSIGVNSRTAVMIDVSEHVGY